MKNLSLHQKRQLRGVIAMTILLFVFSFIFYFNSNKTEEITFGFVLGEE